MEPTAKEMQMIPTLDVHDDHGALLQRSAAFDALPDFIKTASFADRGTAPPDDFALILMDADGVYPRFPRNDAGNTAISTRYLCENHNELSKVAAATAALNLAVACREQRMPVPEALLKLAGIQGEEQVYEKTPYVEVHKGLRLLAGEAKRRNVLDTKPSSVKKDEKSQHGGEGTKLKTASARISYAHTKAAAEHFNENWKRLDPRERVKLAQAIAPSCKAYGIELTKEAYDYAEGVRDMGRVTVCTRVRKWYTADERYDHLEKVAGSMEAPALIEKLWELDAENGITSLWAGKIPDPFLSVLKKQAEAEPERFIAGNEYTTAADLEALARNRPDLVKEQFSDAFAAQFLKSPVTVFKSLPLTTKTILIRMSRDNTGSTKEAAIELEKIAFEDELARLAGRTVGNVVKAVPATAMEVHSSQRRRKKGEGRWQAHKRHTAELGMANERLDRAAQRLYNKRLTKKGLTAATTGGFGDVGRSLKALVKRDLPVFHTSPEKVNKTTEWVKGIQKKEFPSLGDKALKVLKKHRGKAGVAAALVAALAAGKASSREE